MVGPRRGSVEQGREWRRRAGAQRAAAGQGRRKRLGWAAKGGDRAGPRMAARKGPRRAVRLTNSKRAYDAISPTFLPFSPLYHSTGSRAARSRVMPSRQPSSRALSSSFPTSLSTHGHSRATRGRMTLSRQPSSHAFPPPFPHAFLYQLTCSNWVFGAITPTILRALSSPFPQCTPLFAYGQ
ncbi:unnamed protein product [Closterium sp. NIES-65]|nr:unnamed protein product [Closterium sp. NIES-65]